MEPPGASLSGPHGPQMVSRVLKTVFAYLRGILMVVGIIGTAAMRDRSFARKVNEKAILFHVLNIDIVSGASVEV